MTSTFLGYDVTGIHAYVFAPLRPVDILGGSLLLEDFAEQAKKMALRNQGEVLYSGGGQGIFRFPSLQDASTVATQLPITLTNLTGGGARCVTAYVEEKASFADTRRALAVKLHMRRLADATSSPAAVLVPQGLGPDHICQACGLEQGKAQDPLQADLLGQQCQLRRKRGRSSDVPAVPDLFAGDAAGSRATVAALYLDADGLGARLDDVGSADQLTEFSNKLRQAVSEAHAAAKKTTSVLAPVVGGDDLVVFCDARKLLDVVCQVVATLQQHAPPDIHFSAGVVVGSPYIPLRQLFAEAEAALDSAKQASYKLHQPHLTIHALMTGQHRQPSGAILPFPLPLAIISGHTSLRTLLNAVSQVGSAQRANLFVDLSEDSPALSNLLVDERAARHPAVAHARNAAQALGTQIAPQGNAAHDSTRWLLRAGLVLADAMGL